MELSPKLTAKYDKLQSSYPVKRSALIPMLIYGQDELGAITDELIDEIAKRLDLNHVQVCTNIACMLRGGTQLLEHAKKKLEIGHKEVTKDGVFSLEEVECIGA